jgi:hypothetical protein
VKNYIIGLFGCDDETKIKVKMSKDQFSFLTELSKKFEEASTYQCMPTMGIYEEGSSDYEYYKDELDDKSTM